MSERETSVLEYNETFGGKISYEELLGKYLLGDDYKERIFMLAALNGIMFEAMASCPADVHQDMKALELRNELIRNAGPNVTVTDIPKNFEHATLLEVIANLAMEMAFITDSLMVSETELRHRFGAELLQNIGVWDKTNEHIKTCGISELMRVADAGNRVVQRWYEEDGKGSLFPLKNDEKSVTKFVTNGVKNVTLWDQMHKYLNENYETW